MYGKPDSGTQVVIRKLHDLGRNYSGIARRLGDGAASPAPRQAVGNK